LAFGWAEALSLGYAIAMQQAIVRASSPDDITTLLNKAKKFLEASPILPSEIGDVHKIIT
jgi:hypothetical protein